MKARPAFLAFGLAAIATTSGVPACAPAASYPDGDAVKAAQKKWCETLGEIAGAGDDWEHASSCASSYPTASAPFLAALSVCFRKQADQLGAESFDSEQAVKDCTEQSLQELDMRGTMQLDVVNARCERMARCEEISDADCRMGFEGLAPTEQARLTRMYNAGALAAVARCLSSGCEDDEEAAKASCYDDVWEKRAWLPGDS